MSSMIGFLLMLAPLVIVHELGHFLMAKLFGVRADVFSIGFGPKIFSRQWGETEFTVSAIPLGGYVKLFGEDPSQELSPAERKRALNLQAPWKRFLIFFGGPLFNLIFAAILFMGILVIGEERSGNRIGSVSPGSYAEQMGFRPGDEIQDVNGIKMNQFHEFMDIVSDSPGKTLKISILRGTESLIIPVTTVSKEGLSGYGEMTMVGDIPGLSDLLRSTKVGISDLKTPAAKAGFVTGDIILNFNGQEVLSWEELESKFKTFVEGTKTKTASASFNLKSGKVLEVPVQVPATLESLGLRSSELFLKEILPGSPADKAELKPGDRMVSINGTPALSFRELKEMIQAAGEKSETHEATVVIEREGAKQTKVVKLNQTTLRDPALNRVQQYSVGIIPQLELFPAKLIKEHTYNPLILLYEGSARMLDLTKRNFIAIGKLVAGDVSLGTLGGPIMIGKLAGDSLDRGLTAFLLAMAVISVGLGVMNLLPIPVLDGGQIVLLGIEVIRRKPLSVRQLELVQQVGLAMVLLLMVVVMKNDVTRFLHFQ